VVWQSMCNNWAAKYNRAQSKKNSNRRVMSPYCTFSEFSRIRREKRPAYANKKRARTTTTGTLFYFS
jgi:hypothetical protein